MFRSLLVTLALLSLVITFTPQGRAGFRTALFIAQVLEAPAKPQPWFSDEPLREKIRVRSFEGTDGTDGRGMAEVYRLTGGQPRAAVLLSLGASPFGLEDPNVINLGEALARAGYVAMFHWSPTMGLEARIDPAVPKELVQAFRHLEEQDYVDRERIGLGGFSVGASLALVAASDPRIRDRVNFVNALGPYYDAETLLLQSTSRTMIYQEERTPWEPDPLTLRVLTNELLGTLDNAADMEVLTRHFIDDNSATPGELAGLSPGGQTVARLLEGVELEESRTLYATLPAAFRESLAGISPSNHIQGLRARLLLMHDRYDSLVPGGRVPPAAGGDRRARRRPLYRGPGFRPRGAQ